MKKFIALLLALVMVLGLAACSVEQAPAATEAETTEINAENILGKRDFGGETLTFYSRKYNGEWSSDLIAEQEDGTILNDAIYKRNAKLSFP